MLRLLAFTAVTAFTVTLCPAQDPLGILNRTDTSFTSRGSAGPPNTNPSFAFLRIDQEHYAGWGVDPNNPGTRTILGLSYVIQDQIGNTPETYGILVYGEDPTLPDYPDITTPLGMAGGIPTPASTATGAVAWGITTNFATPIQAPAGMDVFPAMDLPQPTTGTWPTDGLSVHALYYVMTSSGTYDQPGASHPTSTQSGNGGYHVPSQMLGPTYTTTDRMWKIEPIVPGATGVAGTITNQTWAPMSGTAPGTSSMSSGLHPDATNPPLNAGRVDDVASRWFLGSAPDNTAVLFFLDIGTLAGEIPASALLAGSTGASCINLATAQFAGVGLTSGGEAFLPITIPTGFRSSLSGLSLVHQAAGVNAATGGVDVNGCTRQVF